MTHSSLPRTPTLQITLGPFLTAHLLPSTLLNPEREKPFSKAPEIKTLSSYPRAHRFRAGVGREVEGGSGQKYGAGLPSCALLASCVTSCPNRSVLFLLPRPSGLWTVLGRAWTFPIPTKGLLQILSLPDHKGDEKPCVACTPLFLLTS